MKTKTATKEATALGKPEAPAAVAASPEEPRDSTTSCADKDRRLEIDDRPGKTHERLIADVVTQGVAINAATAVRFVRPEYGQVSLTDMVASLRESGEAINRNDMSAAERMLCAQGVALNAIFGELARVAQCNLFKNVDAADRYMRLALKAQAQSRMTVETLSAIKNPPTVFARQANFANGHQQINNGEAAKTLPRASEIQPPPSKLLEAHDVERLDAGAKGSTGRTHQDLASVGRLHRPKERGR